MSIKIITKRGNELGSLPSFSKSVSVAFVGESYGEIIYVKPRILEAQNELQYSDSTTLGNLGFTTWITNQNFTNFDIDEIYTDPLDTYNVYVKGLDWNYDSDTQTIIFTDNPIPPPELEGEELATGGSGLNTIGHNYGIVAYGYDGTATTSALSTVITIPASSNTTARHKLSWNKVPHAEGYLIFDTTANRRLAIITNQNTTTFTRNTGTSGTAYTIPSSVTAFRKPPTSLGSVYLYFDYHYSSFDYDVNNFTSLNQVQKKHGVGSPLTNMSRIAFQQYNVPELYLVATDGTTNQKYIDAIDKLQNNENIQYVTALKSSDTVLDYVVTHATNVSSDIEQKERFGVINVANTITEVGDSDTAGTIIYRLRSFLDNKRAIIVVPNGNYVYMNTYQEADGTFTDNKAVPNYYVAGAVASLCVVADDVSTSIMGKELLGFNYGLTGAGWIDSVVQERVRGNGGLYIKSKNGRPVVYNDNTNDTTITENSERSVLSGEDEMRRRLRKSHDQYLGRKITQGLIEAIYSTTSSVLKTMVSQLLINGFNATSLEVKQDEQTKTKVNVVFSYTPIYPLTELIFTYSFDL